MKLLKFILPLIILIFYSSNAFTEEKKRNFFLIDDSTGVGMLEKFKCKKGIKKGKGKSRLINILKGRETIF